MSNTNLQTWIGLDSYDEQNSEIFYGRSEEINEILSSISYNTQTVIYGPSGIGKSSIIKAGIFPKARANYFLPIYVRLNHNDETTYIEQIIKITKEELKKHAADIEKVLKVTDNDEQSLWEFFQSNVFWSKDNFPLTPMIVIDQFEEIFTLARNKKTVESFFEELFDLVNNYVPRYVRKYIDKNKTYIRFSDEINYKLIVILREDFLGKLEDYDAKYPSLRKNRYSLQAINEEQAKDIILKPAGDLVDIDVAKEIIKKITNEAEFEFDDIPEITVEPALLSLFCTELNEKRKSEKKDKITVKLIEDFGDDIIKGFYEREISKVDEKTIEFLENKILTSGGFRDSVAVEDAFQYGIPKEELKTLEDNRIIRISERDGLSRIEYTHDILCKVAQENRENRKINQENIKNKKKGIIKTITISLLTIFIFASAITLYFKYYRTYVQYASILIKNSSFWTGFDDLSKADAMHKTYYYKLSKIGHKGPYTQIEAYDGYGNLTTDHNISTLLLNQWDDDDSGANEEAKEKIKKVCKWRFVKGKDNEILREDAFDKNDSLIFSFTYTQKTNAGDKSFVYGRFTDDKQLPFIQREKGISNIRITHDILGNDVLVEYYDNNDKPAKNSWNAYGEEREYYKNGLLKKHASLNEFGEYMIDRAGNTGQIYEYDDQGNLVKSTSFDENGKTKNVKDGYAIVRSEYDSYGNVTKSLYFDENDIPCMAYGLVYGYASKYNDKGKLSETKYLDKDGSSVIKSEKIYSKMNNGYDSAGNKTSITYFDASSKYYNHNGVAKYVYAYDNDELIESKRYKYEKDADTLKPTYHYKVWLNNKKQKTLKFWFDPTNDYTNYFITSTFNENGDQNSMATYNFPGEYRDLNLNNENLWENIENGLLRVNNLKEGLFKYHKWVDRIETKDTITVFRTFTDSVNTIIEYKETKKFIGKEMSTNYFDAERNLLKGTRYSQNKTGYESSISYIGISGNLFRNPNYQYGAYKLKYSMDIRGEVIGYAAYNEYGERSYARLISLNKTYVFHKYDIKNKIDYDVSDEKITNMDSFAISLPSMYFIYLIPQTHQNAKDKLRDGDIIVGYGSWKYDGDNILGFETEFNKLTDSTKKITLLRLPEEKLITIEAPADNFKINMDYFYLTEKEHKRILAIVKASKLNESK